MSCLNRKTKNKFCTLLLGGLLIFALSIPAVGLISTENPAQITTGAGDITTSALSTENPTLDLLDSLEFNRSLNEIESTTTAPTEPEPTATPAPTETTEAPLTFAPVSYPLYITANTLNLRAEPSTDSEILAKLKHGDKVNCTGENAEWVQITFNGKTGYLKTEYTTRNMVFETVNQAMYVSSNTLNLRAQPSTDSEIIIKLIKNEPLTRIGIGDGWSWVVTSSGTKGYVSTQYLTNIPPFKATISYSDHDYSSVSQTEIDLLIRIVALEGNPKYGYNGYLAITSAILNRVESGRFGSSITAVLSAKNQFSTYTTTRTPYITDTVIAVVTDALAGKRILPSYVMYFITPDAYRKSVASGGSFSRLGVYGIAYNAVWCYKLSDR